MTTEARLSWANDLSVENEVFCLGERANVAGEYLAGAAWVLEGAPPVTAHRLGFQSATSLIHSRFPDYEMWLLVGQSAWQPDSRITRYRRLWNSLEARGVEVPSGDRESQHVLESSQGIRHFGAMQVDFDAGLSRAISTVEAEQSSCIVLGQAASLSGIKGVIATGWPSSTVGLADIFLQSVAGAGCFVLSAVGRFDDREAGVVAFALPEAMKQLKSNSHLPT